MIRKAFPAAILLFALPCWATTTASKKKARTVPVSTHHAVSHSSHVVSKTGSASHMHRGTRLAVAEHHQAAAMDTERATQIQQALIHAGYMSGEPTGVWDSQSQSAMQKMQGDNGWQTKITPDSRALIKLGLGPQSNAAPMTTGSASSLAVGGEQ